MGYLSCNAESAVATCDSYNFELLSKKPRDKQQQQRRRYGNRPLKITEFEFEDLFTATDGFSPGNLLGKGSHGHVYRAHFHQMKLVAAVKRLKQSNSTTDNEVEILSRICHPRLVNLLGFGSDQDRRKLIVVEYMPYGSLHDLIHSPAKPLSWAKRARYALQIAKAIHFLHSYNPPIIHRDIKSTNILIDSSRNCRLSDFGLALMGHIEDAKLRCTPPAGTLGYLDPSYLAPNDLSSKSDVFSFGILLLEIITGRHAIDMYYSPPSVVDWAAPAIKSGDVSGILDERVRAPDDDAAIRRMATTAVRCVRPSAARRPSMEEVVECLKNVCNEMKMARTTKFCVGLGQCANEEACLVKYEVLDDEPAGELEAVKSVGGSKKNARVSSSSSSSSSGGAKSSGDVIVADRVGRSKSIGTASEIKYQPLDHSIDHLSRKMRVGMKMSAVRLGKSRSTGIMQGKRWTNGNMVVDRTILEEYKLLADVIGENVVKEELTQ